MTTLLHLKPADTEEILAALASDGACIVEDLLAPEQCQTLVNDFVPHLEAMPWGQDELGYKNEFYGHRTKRLHGLFSKSGEMESVLTHPVILSIARSLLLKDKKARDIRLSNTELMVLAEHQGEQEFHTDGASWHRAQGFEKARGDEILISTNIALTDFTATNGATRVVPGSHLWASDRVPEPYEVTQAIMPRGAALFYSGNVIHSGGANVDAETRIGLYLGYIVSWLRPIENQLVTNDSADVMALGLEARQLLDVVEGGFTVMA